MSASRNPRQTASTHYQWSQEHPARSVYRPTRPTEVFPSPTTLKDCAYSWVSLLSSVFVVRPTDRTSVAQGLILDGSGRRIVAQTYPTAPKMPWAPFEDTGLGAPDMNADLPESVSADQIRVPTYTADQSVCQPSYAERLCIRTFLSSVVSQTSDWPIYISTTSSHVKSSNTIHFNTCVCQLEICVWTTSRNKRILLHNSFDSASESSGVGNVDKRIGIKWWWIWK